MKHQLLTLFIFFSIGGAMAQDSLQLPIQSQSLAQDTLVIDSLMKLGSVLIGKDLDKALVAYNKAELIADHYKLEAILATIYHKKAIIYYHKVGYNFTESYLKKAIVIRKRLKLMGELAFSYNNLGLVYRNLGYADLALEYLKKAAQVQKGLGLIKNFANSCNGIGVIYNDQGQYEKSFFYLKKAERIRDSLSIGKDRADTYNNLGIVYDNQSNYEKALIYYNKAEKIQDSLGLKLDLATTYNNKGNVYYYQIKYEKALASYKKSTKIREPQQLKIELSETYMNMGVIYNDQGYYKRAFFYLRKAEKIQDSLNLKPKLAATHDNIGLVYDNQGDYEEALMYHQKAKKIRDSLNLVLDLALSYNNIGNIYLKQGRYDIAEINYKKELTIRDTIGPKRELADTYNNIGLVYLGKIEYKVALEKLEIAKKIRNDLGLKKDLADSYNNIGLVYYRKGAYKKALKEYKKALIIRKQLGLEMDIADSYTNIGNIYKNKNRYQKAFSYHKKAIKIREKFGLIIDLAISYNDIADIYYKAEQYQTSLEYYQKSIDLTKILDNKTVSETNKQHWLYKHQDNYQGAITCAYQFYLDELIFELAQEVKAKTLNNLLIEKRAKRVLPKHLVEERQFIYDQITANQRQIKKYSANKTIFTRLKEQQQYLMEQLANHYTKVREQVPEYQNLTYPNPITLAQMQAQLKSGEALIEYVQGVDLFYALVLTNTAYKVIPLDSIETIQQQVEAFNNSIKQMGFSKRPIREQAKSIYFKNAMLLYQSLITPINQTGLIDNKQLTIVPDGNLHQLSFEALVKDTLIKNYKDYHYFVQDHAISYYPSTMTLYHDRNEEKQEQITYKKDVFLIGNPLVKSEKGIDDPFRAEGIRSTLNNLPFAEIEVDSIIKQFPNSDVFKQKKATETVLKNQDLTQYRYLHFACHGALDIKEPLLSGLILTTDSLEDGRLCSYEIFDLKLQADLVTLSACETALGKITPEGVIGLTRSWLYAGASSLVVSLWKVEDKSTADLMTRFYSALKRNNKAKYEALRTAQLEMITKGKTPYQWAGFVFIGETEN